MPFCINCGGEVDESQRFCTACGEAIPERHEPVAVIAAPLVEKQLTSAPNSSASKPYLATPFGSPVDVLVKHAEEMGVHFDLRPKGVVIEYLKPESALSGNLKRVINARKHEIEKILKELMVLAYNGST